MAVIATILGGMTGFIAAMIGYFGLGMSSSSAWSVYFGVALCTAGACVAVRYWPVTAPSEKQASPQQRVAAYQVMHASNP